MGGGYPSGGLVLSDVLTGPHCDLSGSGCGLSHKEKLFRRNKVQKNLTVHEHIKLPAKLLDDFLRSNKSNINQSTARVDILSGVLLQVRAQSGRRSKDFRVL